MIRKWGYRFLGHYTRTPALKKGVESTFCTVLLGVSLVGGLGYRGLAFFAYRVTIICMISALSLQGSVRPKFGFGIKDRNQGPI